MEGISKEEYEEILYKRICLLQGAALYVIEGIDNLEGDFGHVWKREVKFTGNAFRKQLIKATNSFVSTSSDQELTINDMQNSLENIFSGLEPKVVELLWKGK